MPVIHLSKKLFKKASYSIVLTTYILSLSLADTKLQPELIEKGAYIAILGDCVACHTTTHDKPYAGGLVFEMPMGAIVSSNITPSKKYGIGSWSEQEFSDAVRKGIRPDGRHLYPAMPYPAYANVTDGDISALYAYFMAGVTPIESQPDRKTSLHFPFNLPGLMSIWNMLFVQEQTFVADPNLTNSENRGKYLVDGLTHCSTCHTPRNQMMAESYSQYLSGGNANGWYAPNITPDSTSGIGGWTRDEILSYLQTGRAQGKSYAAGPMAEAIDLSFRHIKPEDLNAIIDYLLTLPKHHNEAQKEPAYSFGQRQEVAITEYEQSPYPANNMPYFRDTDIQDGAILYNAACATCHGIQGEGSLDKNIPSLTKNGAIGRENRSNLVMAISEGVHRIAPDGKIITLMPAFSLEKTDIHSWLTPAQIASVSNYITQKFGDGEATLTEKDVVLIQSGGKQPFLIKHAAKLAIIGGVFALFALFSLGYLFFRKRD